MSITIEAKQQWPTLGVRDANIKGWFQEADTEAARNYESTIRAGLTFLTPKVDQGTDLDEVTALFDRLRSAALHHGADALAWWIPPRASDSVFISKNSEKSHIYPGILTVLRIAKIRGLGRVANKDRLPRTEWTPIVRSR
jgi:hypothetical protein